MNKQDRQLVDDLISEALRHHRDESHKDQIAAFDCPACGRKAAGIFVREGQGIDTSHTLCLSCGGKFRKKTTVVYDKLP